MFKVNVGTTDRVIRAVAGVFLIAFAVLGPEMAYTWIAWFGVPILLTAVFKYCPAYSPFGINTGADSEQAPEA